MFKITGRKILFKIMPLVVCGLVSILLPARPALAASVDVSPNHGETGSLIQINGTGFTPGADYDIYFAYNTGYEDESSGTVALDGSVSHFAIVPEIPGGDYDIRIATSFESASDTFEVEPEISLDRTSATVGERVDIEGTGFRANRTVRIKFESDTVETTSTNSRGSFSETFTVPESDHGSHDVSADDGIYRIETNLAVDQSIAISPRSGAPGTEVTVTGTGFRDDHSIIISFDGDPVDTDPTSITTDGDGSFSATFDLPTCINRNPEITASDGRYRDSAEFTILASLSLSPNSEIVGNTVTLTGNGFRSNRSIKITFDGAPLATLPGTVRSNSTGCFDAEFEVPPSINGKHEIKADDGAETAEADFTTLAAIDLDPSSGPINAEVAISGTGFDADKVVTIRFNDEHVRTGATDASGSFSDMFTVPESSTGNYNVIASDGTRSSGAIFTVTTSVAVSPQTGHVGTLITVRGNGFTGAIDVHYDDEEIANTTADADGSFTVSFNAPASRHGHHNVVISDAVNTIETTFTMESDAPPVPALVLPENGSRQGSRPMFEWSPVSDPSGVTYTLQVATDNSFSTIILEKNGLTQSQYTLSREEGLQQTDIDTPYYWRVQATDGAFNESGWATPLTFYVQFLPLWALFTIIAAASAVIAALVSKRVFGRRKEAE